MKIKSVPSLLTLGIDIGSTTSKVVLCDGDTVLHSAYERHFADARGKVYEMVRVLADTLGDRPVRVAISGSAGMGLAEEAGIPFVQEVYATSKLVRGSFPTAKTVIELGGEDAKILFLGGGTDARMNGTCAGGTGAFIDQMATLLDLSNDEMDELSLRSTRIYPIASRCGVFAKSDIQSLLNQGASKEDIAASVYQAVVNQTIAGLAQGTPIEKDVVFLGGPLYFCRGLRRRFTETLELSENEAIFPEDGRFSVALGACAFAVREGGELTYVELMRRLLAAKDEAASFEHDEPLFASEADYRAFCDRHAKAAAEYADIADYTGRAYLGIDCGSTTTKLVLLDEDGRILYSYYCGNKGNPVGIVHEQLQKVRALCGDRVIIGGSAVTGYGEELICHAFHVDAGLVETMAHLKAAQHFNPQVDFILDIGGQDIKCFRIHNGAVDSIMLNEACSSGCGSFLETFAHGVGLSVEEFARRGLFAKAPAQLGTRCTVFMNSSVKQAQKDGASVEDISAGLSISVVKNALYKVIRTTSAEALGEHIVVQGGTFYNDSVLRSFERETGREVTRPAIAGLMGAYGAALYAKALHLPQSALLDAEGLAHFAHKSTSVVCKGCANACNLTVNTFADGGRYISGNRCEKGAGGHVQAEGANLYEFKRQYLLNLPEGEGDGPVIGIPLALQMYDSLPFWHAILRALGFRVVLSGMSDKNTYYKGQASIPSDTVCYPAKLMHGHIERLVERGVPAIFYPCATWNFEEPHTDNHYNCPVVAYYSEVLRSNMPSVKKVNFYYPYLDMTDAKKLTYSLMKFFKEHGFAFSRREVRAAVEAGRRAYDAYREAVRTEGQRVIAAARKAGGKILVLAGRPYHIDSEINHGIDTLARSLGFYVVSEDSICDMGDDASAPHVRVLNQWSFHSRLYKAARVAAEQPDMYLVQLVSFGCGLDAITTDEVREILEGAGKLYTQLKIDEITNLGAVKIRLRSLLGAIEERSAT